AGLDEQTAVTFGDIGKFENILKRKIVVFHRTTGSTALFKFETGFPDCSNPLFLLLFQGHYYGIKNLKGFIGADISVDTVTAAMKMQTHTIVKVIVRFVTHINVCKKLAIL
ncbi:hypothetical protein ILYODFUR_036455, partial [Ilyodon furcidens]